MLKRLGTMEPLWQTKVLESFRLLQVTSNHWWFLNGVTYDSSALTPLTSGESEVEKADGLLWGSVTETKSNNHKSITPLLTWLTDSSLFGSLKWPDHILHIIWVYTWLHKPFADRLLWYLQWTSAIVCDVCSVFLPFGNCHLFTSFDSGRVVNNFTPPLLLSWSYPFLSHTTIDSAWACGPTRDNNFLFRGIIWVLWEGRDGFFSGIMSMKNHVWPELPGAFLPESLSDKRKNKRQAELKNGNGVLLIVIDLLFNKLPHLHWVLTMCLALFLAVGLW